jgi:hypothetical protein
MAMRRSPIVSFLIPALAVNGFAMTGTDRGTGTHATGATTFTLAPSGNFTAGSMAVLVVAADNTAGGGGSENFTSVTDTLGNTWTEQRAVIFDNGAASAGVQGAIYTTLMNGGTLQTSTTITVTFGTSTTAKAWALMEVSPVTGLTMSVIASGAGTGVTTAAPTVTSGSITSGDMVIGGLFNEQGTGQTVTQDGDTTNGSWSTQQTAEVGTTDTGMTVASQRKIVTGTATQTYNPTLGVSSDTNTAWLQLREVDTTPPTISLNTADAFDFGVDNTPALEMTATDGAAADVRYNILIATNSFFGVLLDSYSESNQSGSGNLSSVNEDGYGQSFAGANQTIMAAKFYLKKSGVPTGNATARIYAHTGTFGSSGIPTGAALATSGTFDVSTLTTSYQLITFTFSGLSISSGTNYFVACEYSGGDGSNNVQIRFDLTSPIHGGNLAYLDGGVWTADSSGDMVFYIYYDGALLDKVSGTDAGFLNTVTGGDTDPFNSGEKVSYTVQGGDALADGTYYWKARASDPSGSNTFSSFASTRTFIIASGATPTPTPSLGSFFPLIKP